MDNFSPRYEFITTNLQGLKELLTRVVLEDALRSRYNVRSCGKKENSILDTALFVSGSKPGRGVGRGEGQGRTNKGKLDIRGRIKGIPSQVKITCDHCQTPGHIRPNYPECQCFKCRGWGHAAISYPCKVLTPKEN